MSYRWSLGYSCVFLGFMAGCVSSPRNAPDCRETRHSHRSAPVDYPPQIPAAVPPVEPPLEGVHSLDFYVQAALNRNPEVLAADRHAAALGQIAP